MRASSKPSGSRTPTAFLLSTNHYCFRDNRGGGQVEKAAGRDVLCSLFHSTKKCFLSGVPAVAQWIKNQTAVARVTVEAWVQSPARHSELKDLVLPQLQHRSKLWLGFKSWPRNFYMSWVWLFKKKKKVSEFLYQWWVTQPQISRTSWGALKDLPSANYCC